METDLFIYFYEDKLLKQYLGEKKVLIFFSLRKKYE